jgi:prolyl-tRNA synthetase
MKDLYTFDYNPSLALATYHQVREAYARLFDELKIPYLVAEADSGDMGGNLSHEFHFPTSKGEDHVISCIKCDYVANEELAESRAPNREATSVENSDMSTDGLQVWRGISRDRLTLINVWYLAGRSKPAASSDEASQTQVNIRAIKTVIPEFDASIDNALTLWPNDTADAAERPHAQQLVNLVDSRLPRSVRKSIESEDSHLPFWPTSSRRPREIRIETLSQDPITAQPLNLLRISDGDACCRCADGTLKVQKAIELGHTFHLGTRYSEPLMANVMVPPDLIEDNRAGAQEKFSTDGTSASQQVPMQMGCHGIGISRMIGAVADTLADEKGLNWPRVMAPFEVVVIPSKGLDSAASEIYDTLSYAPTSPGNSQLDLVLDDRSESFPWKMQDADLVGYPIIVIVSRRWKKEQMCEIQCRRLGVREEVYIGDLAAFVKTLLAKI